MDKHVIHTHIHMMEYNTAIKKNKILPFVTTWMDLEGIMLSEIKSQNDKCCMNLKNTTN